jgi:hypothetical protein
MFPLILSEVVDATGNLITMKYHTENKRPIYLDGSKCNLSVIMNKFVYWAP